MSSVSIFSSYIEQSVYKSRGLFLLQYQFPDSSIDALQVMEAGCLDEYVLRLLPLIDSQLFGGVAEEKEAGAFAGTREAKKLRAYDTYQLLAQGITFDTQLANLLSLVRLFFLSASCLQGLLKQLIWD